MLRGSHCEYVWVKNQEKLEVAEDVVIESALLHVDYMCDRLHEEAVALRG